jgi:enoyl-CoA hydratase
MNEYLHIIVERRQSVALVRFNRPKALNALCQALMDELAVALNDLDNDDECAVIVLTGDDRAFAAGADITEMKDVSYQHMLDHGGLTKRADSIANCRKPVIAAVAGYALGGGCELAMMCDFIIAADNAMFGQPEITIGTIPGFGGSQRLTGLVGKSKAMDMCLTGRMMNAAEAERSGLVSRVESLDQYLEVALEAAAIIAAYSRPVVAMAKDVVNTALESSLAEGIRAERRLFKSTFALDDQKEGMSAFVEKRSPSFKHR